MSLKICILMWYDNGIKEYGDIAYNINKIYCEKYNYSIIKSDNREYTDRKPHWERLPLILKHLDNFDYIIWIDADAFFNINSPPITNVINKHKDKSIILSADYNYNNNYYVNSGFFIVKNNKNAKKIIKEWAYSDTIFKKRYGFNDQGGIRYIIGKNLFNIKQESIIIEFGILQNFYKHKKFIKKYGLINNPFVNHLANMNKENRIKILNSYYLILKYVKGSWINTSKNYRIENNYLICECKNKKGKYIKNKIKIEKNKIYNFINNNGILE